MIELQVQQGTREWLNARAKCFNASEAPAMMGVSAYMSRSELLKQKATGIIPEPDAATLGRFNAGHEAEANARPLVEAIIGEELYPIVATDDEGRLLASSDGATMLCNIGFEHKLWNEGVAAQVREGNVPDSHKWQLDQQIAVFGFEKIVFVCSDGTPEKFVYCWYYPQPERIAQLRAGWDQFEIDLKNYQHVEAKPAAVAESIEDLPALAVQLTGQVTSSNLATFQSVVLDRIKAINTNLVTDNDFATADKMVKFLDDGEKRLDLVKAQALSQTASIDELFRTIDSLKAEMRSKRLTLDKLVKAEKENRKAEIVTGAHREFSDHLAGLLKRVGVPIPAIGSFAEAIKGLKSLDSMRDKVSVALANAKVEANAVADRIEANRKTVDDMSLFPDFAQVCTKAPDDFAALLSMRVGQRKEAEEKRLEAERERIRAEEERRANILAAEQIAAERRAAQAQADLQNAKPSENHIEQPLVMVDQPAPATVKESLTVGPTIKLGEICARLGYTVSADFLASLGFEATTEKNARLYPASQFPVICRKIADHTLALAFKKAA